MNARAARALSIGLGLSLTTTVVNASDLAFREWVNEWTRGDERANALTRFEAIASDADQGPSAVLTSLQNRIEALDGSGPEVAWQRSMLCHMDLSHRGALEQTPVGAPLTDDTQRAIDDAVARFAGLRLARFRPQPPMREPPMYVIFAGSNDPCGQIAIEPTWTGNAAKEIYKAADLLDQLRADAAIPSLESMARTVEESRAKWHSFFENVVYDGFPWELYANELAKTLAPALRGTLAQPPSAQLRALHPTPLMSVSTHGKTTFTANFGIEAFGWRTYDTQTYSPRWGLSALVSLRQSRDESTGYGLLATFRGWSIGLVQRDTSTRDDEIQVVVGVDVAQWIQRTRTDTGSLRGVLGRLNDELTQGWTSAVAVEEKAKARARPVSESR